MPESKVLLKYEADATSLNKTLRANKRVEDSLEEVAKGTKAITSNASKMGDVIAKEAKQAANAVDDLEAATRRANDRFDETSKKVALAGDVESNLRAVGGAAGAVGLGGVGTGIGVAAELPALVEALPRLQTSLAGMPAATSSAASALGTSVGALGAVGVAAAAFVVGFKLLTSSIEAANQELEQRVDFERELAGVVRQGSEAAAQRIADARAAISDEQKALEEARRTRVEQAESFQVSDLFSAVITDTEDKARQLESASQDVINEQQKMIDELVGEFGPGILEAADMIEQGTQQVNKSLLDAASDAATAIQQQQNASKMGVDAANERIAAIQEETAVIEAELAVLRQSGDTSEEVTDRIAQLEGQLKSLGRESGVVSNQIKSGAAERIDAAKEAEKAAEEQARKQEQALQKAEAANQKYADSVENIARQTQFAITDAGRKAKDARADLSKELSDTLFEDVIANAQEQSDILRDGQREEAQAARDHQRELKDIRKEAARSDRDALKNRNFLALEEIAESTKDRIEDAKGERDALADERKFALNEELQDFKINASRQRAERQRDFNKSLRDLQQNSARELRDIQMNRQRQLQLAAQARSKELQLTQEFYSKSVKIAQEAINKIEGVNSGGTGPGRRGIGALAGGTAGALSLVESVVS